MTYGPTDQRRGLSHTDLTGQTRGLYDLVCAAFGLANSALAYPHYITWVAGQVLVDVEYTQGVTRHHALIMKTAAAEVSRSSQAGVTVRRSERHPGYGHLPHGWHG